ncbi:MAG: hypothetical protein JWN15_3638 [Firmicutes bacterium]|nr:hypothetical protein [Bacillota bacterium]
MERSVDLLQRFANEHPEQGMIVIIVGMAFVTAVMMLWLMLRFSRR